MSLGIGLLNLQSHTYDIKQPSDMDGLWKSLRVAATPWSCNAHILSLPLHFCHVRVLSAIIYSFLKSNGKPADSPSQVASKCGAHRSEVRGCWEWGKGSSPVSRMLLPLVCAESSGVSSQHIRGFEAIQESMQWTHSLQQANSAGASNAFTIQ